MYMEECVERKYWTLIFFCTLLFTVLIVLIYIVLQVFWLEHCRIMHASTNFPLITWLSGMKWRPSTEIRLKSLDKWQNESLARKLNMIWWYNNLLLLCWKKKFKFIVYEITNTFLERNHDMKFAMSCQCWPYYKQSAGAGVGLLFTIVNI